MRFLCVLLYLLTMLFYYITHNTRLPHDRITLQDPKFGIADFVFESIEWLLFTVCEDMHLLSSLDARLTNVRLPWEDSQCTAVAFLFFWEDLCIAVQPRCVGLFVF